MNSLTADETLWTTGPYADDLRLALELASSVDALTMNRFHALDLQVEAKADLSPVSDADLATEKLIRSRLSEERPGDGVIGEEFESTVRGARRWIIDPIDGTKNFVRGVPVWATLIALADEDEIVVGVVSAPALGRRWWAAQGAGAWLQALEAPPERLSVSGITQLSEASLSYSSLGGWRERGLLDAFVDFGNKLWRTRAYGDFWSYMLVAEGTVDLAAEPELEVYDMAALVPIVVEAGGIFTSLDGQPGPWDRSALVGNPTVHALALKEFQFFSQEKE